MNKIVLKLSISVVILVLVGCSSPSSEVVEEFPAESQGIETEVEQSVPTSTAVPTATLPPPVVSSATPLQPTATPVPPTEAPTIEPTATAVEVIPTVVEDMGESAAASSTEVVFGRTAEGAFFYGSPTAEITLIDYSEFL